MPNPFRPGVGKKPPYLADREAQIRRFTTYIEDYPANRRNIRVTGLRGVGKTVLLKEYEKLAERADWIVIRRDFMPRMNQEHEFAVALGRDMQKSLEKISTGARIAKYVNAARAAITPVVNIGDLSITVDPTNHSAPSILEDRLSDAMIKLGIAAVKANKGVLFLYDEAHVLADSKSDHQYPLSALLSTIVAVQDYAELDLPVMLVLAGLPPLTANLQEARSHSERLFKAEQLGNLSLTIDEGEAMSPAAAALLKVPGSGSITFDAAVAEEIARDVNGYPYFVQWFGEALWDAAESEGVNLVTHPLYVAQQSTIQSGLDGEFFDGRYEEALAAEQKTLRYAAALGGETFLTRDIVARFKGTLKANAVSMSINRLLAANLIYRLKQGEYAYTAPLFGDYVRRRHPAE